jgi:hypothetical protein
MNLKVDITSERCDQCLFGKNKLVSNKRRREILKQCSKNDVHFECHKGTIKGKKVMCRGFFDVMPTQTQKIAQALGMFNKVKPSDI